MASQRSQTGESEETKSAQMSPGDPRRLGELEGDLEPSKTWEEHIAEQARRYREILQSGATWAEDLEGAGERHESRAQSVTSQESMTGKATTWWQSGYGGAYRRSPPPYPGNYMRVEDCRRDGDYRASNWDNESQYEGLGNLFLDVTRPPPPLVYQGNARNEREGANAGSTGRNETNDVRNACARRAGWDETKRNASERGVDSHETKAYERPAHERNAHARSVGRGETRRGVYECSVDGHAAEAYERPAHERNAHARGVGRGETRRGAYEHSVDGHEAKTTERPANEKRIRTQRGAGRPETKRTRTQRGQRQDDDARTKRPRTRPGSRRRYRRRRPRVQKRDPIGHTGGRQNDG